MNDNEPISVPICDMKEQFRAYAAGRLVFADRQDEIDFLWACHLAFPERLFAWFARAPRLEVVD